MKELFDQLEYLFREVLWGGTGGQESHEDTELKEEEEEPPEDDYSSSYVSSNISESDYSELSVSESEDGDRRSDIFSEEGLFDENSDVNFGKQYV